LEPFMAGLAENIEDDLADIGAPDGGAFAAAGV
jgi:hypothetical protein